MSLQPPSTLSTFHSIPFTRLFLLFPSRLTLSIRPILCSFPSCRLLLFLLCNRLSLCQALVDIAAKQDASSSLLNTLASLLLSSFSPSDVLSASGRAVCADALQIVASLSNRGHLGGNAQVLAELLSVFTIQRTYAEYGTGSLYDISSAASSLVQGVQLGMAYGQGPVLLITPNMQLRVTSTLIFASNNIVLTTPATSGSLQSTVTLGPKGLQGCGAINEYAHLSVLQWSINPYATTTALKTPILRVAYSKQVAKSDVQSNRRVLSQSRKSSVNSPLTGEVAY